MEEIPADFIQKYRYDPSKIDPVMKKRLDDRLRELRQKNEIRLRIDLSKSMGKQYGRDIKRDKLLQIFTDFKFSDMPKKYEQKLYERLTIFYRLHLIIKAYFTTSEDAYTLYIMGASYPFMYRGTMIDTPRVISDFRKYRDVLIFPIYERYLLESSDNPDDHEALKHLEFIDRIGT
jgi:hypothetical protein